jgi:hypothetical protein
MGEGEGASAETQAHDLGSRQKENRGGSAGAVGEVESKAEEESNLNVECNRRQTHETCESLQQPNLSFHAFCQMLQYGLVEVVKAVLVSD